jgi:hypothetical protein
MGKFIPGLFLKQNIPVTALRHNDRPVYVEEHFGGRILSDWPVFRFFELYAQHQTEEAKTRFSDWYVAQYERYGSIPKKNGGMQGGSLENLIKRLHADAGKPFDPASKIFDKDLLRRAAEMRTGQRFALLEDILKNGFRQSNDDYISGIRRGERIVLDGGHHRVAALMVAGQTHVPRMMVFPNKVAVLLHRLGARVS